jgi:hypothetical protein
MVMMGGVMMKLPKSVGCYPGKAAVPQTVTNLLKKCLVAAVRI